MKNNKFLDALFFITNIIVVASIVWLGIFNVNGFRSVRYHLVVLGIIALIGIISSKFGSWLGSKVSDIRTKVAERKRLKEEERLKAEERIKAEERLKAEEEEARQNDVIKAAIAGMNGAAAREMRDKTSDPLVKEWCNERIKMLKEEITPEDIDKMSEEEVEELLYTTSNSQVAKLCDKRLDELEKIKELRAKRRTKAKQVEAKSESTKTK